VREIDRPHPREKIGDLLGRVGQEFGMTSMVRIDITIAATITR
jgi:hypothetical protein